MLRRRTKTFGILLIGLGAASCAPEPDLVYIDLSKVPPYPAEQALMPGSASADTISAVGGQLEEMPAVEITSGDLAARARLAQEEIRQNSEQLFEELRARLIKGYDAELAVTQAEESQKLADAYQEEVTRIIGEIEEAFRAQAEIIGDYTYDLARIMGFPDPDPKSRRRGTLSSDPEEFEQAKWLRWEIARLRSECRLMAQRMMADARSDLRAAQAELEMDLAFERQDLVAQAEAQARESALQDVNQAISTVFNPDQMLEPLEGISTTIAGETLAPPIWPWIAPKRETLWANRLRDQAKIYAESRGWQLVQKPDGAQNKTQEFIEWRQSLTAED